MDAKANTHLCVFPRSRKRNRSRGSYIAHSAYMIVVRGGIPGTMVRLSERGTSLGRSSETTFQIDDITVSRQHAFVAIDRTAVVSDHGRGEHQRHVRERQANCRAQSPMRLERWRSNSAGNQRRPQARAARPVTTSDFSARCSSGRCAIR